MDKWVDTLAYSQKLALAKQSGLDFHGAARLTESVLTDTLKNRVEVVAIYRENYGQKA